jgi:hypothetical protein
MSSALGLLFALRRGASSPAGALGGQGAATLPAVHSRGALAGQVGRYLLLIGLSAGLVAASRRLPRRMVR